MALRRGAQLLRKSGRYSADKSVLGTEMMSVTTMIRKSGSGQDKQKADQIFMDAVKNRRRVERLLNGMTTAMTPGGKLLMRSHLARCTRKVKPEAQGSLRKALEGLGVPGEELDEVDEAGLTFESVVRMRDPWSLREALPGVSEETLKLLVMVNWFPDSFSEPDEDKMFANYVRFLETALVTQATPELEKLAEMYWRVLSDIERSMFHSNDARDAVVAGRVKAIPRPDVQQGEFLGVAHNAFDSFGSAPEVQPARRAEAEAEAEAEAKAKAKADSGPSAEKVELTNEEETMKVIDRQLLREKTRRRRRKLREQVRNT